MTLFNYYFFLQKIYLILKLLDSSSLVLVPISTKVGGFATIKLKTLLSFVKCLFWFFTLHCHVPSSDSVTLTTFTRHSFGDEKLDITFPPAYLVSNAYVIKHFYLKNHWSIYWYTSCNKCTSGFPSNTLLIRIHEMYRQLMARMKWSKINEIY